jgi:hypothetical protein
MLEVSILSPDKIDARVEKAMVKLNCESSPDKICGDMSDVCNNSLVFVAQ